MGHIAIPRNVISTMSKMPMWVQLKKNPRYWLMVSACVVAAPSCAISTMVQKTRRYDVMFERANARMLKEEGKYQRYLNNAK